MKGQASQLGQKDEPFEIFGGSPDTLAVEPFVLIFSSLVRPVKYGHDISRIIHEPLEPFFVLFDSLCYVLA